MVNAISKLRPAMGGCKADSKSCDAACMDHCKEKGVECGHGKSCPEKSAACGEDCMKKCKEQGIECGDGKPCPMHKGSH